MHKKRSRYLVTVPILLLFTGISLWLGRSYLLSAEEPEYVTVPAVRRTIEETVSATGVINAFQQVDVGAQVSGQIQSLKVSLGDTVKKGDLLAIIDPSVKKNDLKDAEAQLKSVLAQKQSKEALLEQYGLEYRRQKTMRRSNASAAADLESAEANLKSARSDIEALQAQITQAEISVDTARTNLGYTQILAPMDGVVVAVETDEGQTLVSSQSAPTLLILADLDTMTVKTLISEADVIRVKAGMPVHFSVLGDPDTIYQSTLRSVDPAPENITDSDTSAKTISSSATYYNGRFDIANPEHKLRIFMTAQVSIVLGEAENTLSIPMSVLGEEKGSGQYEIRVLSNGIPEFRRIRTGLKDNVYIEVTDGLSEGERIILGDSVSSAESVSQSSTRGFRGPPPGGRGMR